MKKFYLSTVLLLMTTSIFPQSTWEFKGDYDNVLEVQNVNTYAYTNSNVLYFTSDGDQTSTTSDLSLSSFSVATDVFSVNSSVVYAARRNLNSSTGNTTPQLWKSNDGGATFTLVSAILASGFTGVGQSNFSFHFFSENVGIAWGLAMYNNDPTDAVFRTTDGGQNWDTIAYPIDDVNDFKDIVVETDGDFYIYTEDKIILSTDEGATWQEINDNPLDNSGEFAHSSNTIYGVGWAGSQNPCRVKSTDEGSTFGTFTIPDEDNGGIRECNSSTSSSQLIAVRGMELVIKGSKGGNEDRVVYSDDEGVTWQETVFPSGTNIDYGYPEVSRGQDVFYFFIPFDGELYMFGDDGSGGSTGVNELAKMSFDTYPNPTTGQVNFEKPLTGNLTISNINGEIVESLQLNQSSRVDISDLQRGVYFMKINQSLSKIVKL
jgi:photosystem II stability/assembly factor-like uncharacterized protein